jgi:hypothetical protein
VGLDRWSFVEMKSNQVIRNVVSTAPVGVFDIRSGDGGILRGYYYNSAGKSVLRQDLKGNSPDVRLITVTAAAGNGPRSVIIRGMQPGKTVLTLTDVEGTSETFPVEARRELLLPPGIAFPLPSPTMERIARVSVDNASIIKAARDAKGENVLVESLAVGETTLRVTDTAGKTEPVVIQVRKPMLFLTEGEQKKIQRPEKEILRRISNDNDGVLKVQPAKDDATTVVIEAIGPGFPIFS